MAGEERLGQRMAAAYTVSIDGVERTRSELAKLDGAIKQLRQAQYTPVTSATVAASLGGKDLFVTKIDALEGRVQTAAEKAMAAGMAKARRLQTVQLNAAVTPTGLSGRPKGRKSAGRNVTSHMINSIGTNVETLKAGGHTQITGWHGWGTEVRSADESPYITVQEKGNREGDGDRAPIEAANSLGHAIPVVREFLKTELGKLRT